MPWLKSLGIKLAQGSVDFLCIFMSILIKVVPTCLPSSLLGNRSRSWEVELNTPGKNAHKMGWIEKNMQKRCLWSGIWALLIFPTLLGCVLSTFVNRYVVSGGSRIPQMTIVDWCSVWHYRCVGNKASCSSPAWVLDSEQMWRPKELQIPCGRMMVSVEKLLQCSMWQSSCSLCLSIVHLVYLACSHLRSQSLSNDCG